MAEIRPIHFSRDLQKVLFPEGSFYKYSKMDTAGADVETVEIPLAGQIPIAGEGDPALPLAVQERTDDKKEYTVRQVYTKPILVRRENEIVINYNKRQDIIEQMGQTINTKVADRASYEFATDTNVVVTTGTARANDLVGATGATRKAVTKADMLNVLNIFSKMNLPAGSQIYGLLPPEFVNDLLNIAEFVDYDKTGELSKLKMGRLGTILGMNLMSRYEPTTGSIGTWFSSTNTKKSAVNGDTVATSDNAGAIFWSPSFVRHAEGHAGTFIDRGKPEYLGGTLLSSTVRFGATQSRSDATGVVSLVADA